MKLLTESRSTGTLSVPDGLSGVGPPPILTMSHVFAIWMYRRAFGRAALTQRICHSCFPSRGASHKVIRPATALPLCIALEKPLVLGFASCNPNLSSR
jgi:hypothetical protein